MLGRILLTGQALYIYIYIYETSAIYIVYILLHLLFLVYWCFLITYQATANETTANLRARTVCPQNGAFNVEKTGHAKTCIWSPKRRDFPGEMGKIGAEGRPGLRLRARDQTQIVSDLFILLAGVHIYNRIVGNRKGLSHYKALRRSLDISGLRRRRPSVGNSRRKVTTALKTEAAARSEGVAASAVTIFCSRSKPSPP